MRVLVIGGTGLLGRAIAKEWTDDELTCTGSRDADIRDKEQVTRLVRTRKPDWTILAAAYTDVDGCETSPERAYSVNVEGAANVAQAVRQSGSHLLLLGTDYVFDGEKSVPYEVDDAKQPLNIYGRTKSEGEDRAREVVPEICIVRTSWLFGTEGKCFPGSILSLARSRTELTVVTDQRGRPTFNRDLAKAIRGLVKADARGIYHAANEGECSWFEFAQEVLQQAGLAHVRATPITTEELPRAARRPKYSVLSTRSLQRHGIVMRPWQAALADYIRDWQYEQEMTSSQGEKQ